MSGKKEKRLKLDQKRVSAARCVFPAQSEKGGADVLMDDGSSFRVHSTLLTLESPILEDVVSLAQREGRARTRIPLRSTSVQELQALIGLLYSKRRESYLLDLPLEQLGYLSSVRHRFSMDELLG